MIFLELSILANSNSLWSLWCAYIYRHSIGVTNMGRETQINHHPFKRGAGIIKTFFGDDLNKQYILLSPMNVNTQIVATLCYPDCKLTTIAF